MNTDNVTVSSQIASILSQNAKPTYDWNKGAIPGGEAHPDQDLISGEAPAEPQAAPASEPEAPDAKNQPPIPDFDSRLQKLTAQQRKIQEERAAFKAEQEQFRAEREEFARYKELKARAKEDPVAWAEEAGIKPDEYATMLMEKGSFSPERRRLLEQQKELNELKSWKQQQEEQAKAAQFNNLQQTVMNDLQGFVKSEGDRFDLVARTGAYPQVIKEIQEHYQQTMDPDIGQGEILSYEEALERVEARLVTLYEPLLESKKLRSKLGLETSAPTLGQPALRKPSATITNKMGGKSAGAPRPLTEAERMAAAGDFFLKQLRGGR